MSVRERIVSARQSKSLAWADHQRAVDVIAASGMADRLGGVLTRLRDNNDPSSYRGAVEALKAKLPPHQINDRVCRQALLEWLIDKCQDCGGRTTTKAARAVVGTCPTCDGTGARRWWDVDRAHALGLSLRDYRRDWARSVEDVLRLIDSAVRQYTDGVRRKIIDKPEKGNRITIYSTSRHGQPPGTDSRNP